MKKIISAFLAAVMILSTIPVTGFAKEENAPNESVTEATGENDVPENWGLQAEDGDVLYYIEDGSLLCSVKNGRPQTISESVNWVVKRNNAVFYSKIEGNNTDIYKKVLSEDSNFEKQTRLFVPIDCFDVDGDELYYLWNGEIIKNNGTDTDEQTITIDKGMSKFYISNDKCIINIPYSSQKSTTDVQLSASSAYEITQRIDELRQLFEDKYWSVGMWDNDLISAVDAGYADMSKKFTMSEREKKLGLSNYGGSNNHYGGGIQCHGFGMFMIYCLFGDRISESTIYRPSNIDSLQPGDYIRTQGDHGAIVWKIEGDHLYCLEAWGSQGSIIKYSDGFYGQYRTTSASAMLAKLKREGWFYRSSNSLLKKSASIETPPVDTSSAANYEPIDENADLGNISVVVDINKTKSTVKGIFGGLFKNFVKNAASSFAKKVVSSVVNKVTGSVDKVVTVYGTVKSKTGEIFYKLSNEYYVKKSEFDKKFKKHQSSTASSEKVSGIISYSNMSEPSGSAVYKQGFTLKGTISSTANISSIKGEVINVNTGVSETSKTVYPNTMTYSIAGNSLDRGIRFQNLKLNNTYYIRYTTVDSTGSKKEWQSDNFKITSSGGITAPDMPSVWVESIEGGQRAVVSTNTNLDLHLWSDVGETHGKGTLTMDFTTEGNHQVDGWTSRGNVGSIKNHQTLYVSKCETPSISDVKFNDSSAVVTISGSGNIYYTLDGSTPTKNSRLYTGPINLKNSCTIKAMSAQWGCVNSNIAEKQENVSPPDAPVITLNTKEKVAQGKSASVSWNPTERATKYAAILYRGGTEVKRVETTGTTATFTLDDKSDTENIEYTIKVVAQNFKGSSGSSNAATVWGMHPLNVTFIDRITRNESLTEEKLNAVKAKLDAKYGDAGAMLENRTLSKQKVDYGEMPSKPATPSKTGFTFTGWSSGLYEATTADKTVYGEFDINYYSVAFYDVDNENKRMGNALSVEKYMYTDEAVLPDNYDVPAGYVFEGWNIDNTKSTGFDLSFIDGNIIADAVYAWENTNLPQFVSISKIERHKKSYEVTVNIKNCPIEETQGRIVVSLYTSSGRNVYTQITENDLDIGGTRDWTDTKVISLVYDGKISYAKAYVVAVKNDKTGGALSKVAESSDITYNYSDYWSNWSDYKTAEECAAIGINVNAPNDALEVKSTTQYRYRNRVYRESRSSAANGWEHYNTKITSYGSTQGPVYYDPSGNGRKVWSERYVTSSNYKTVYHYFRYANSRYGGNGAAYSAYPNYYTYDFDYELPRYTGNYGYKMHWGSGSGDWNTVWRADYLGNAYTTRQWVSDNYGTRWYFQEPIYTYYFRSWGNWSGWSYSWHSGDDTQTRTVYSYRTLSTDDTETEVGDGYIYSRSSVLPDMGTEYITEERFNEGKNEFISGPYYIKDGEFESDEDKYILVEDSTREAKEYRYGRYTNGAYTMPCAEAAENTYGGEWRIEWSEWSETPASEINENVYLCEGGNNHEHKDAKNVDGVDCWDEYVVNGESYCFAEERTSLKDVTYSDKTKYYKVKTSLEGQVATVMIYKKSNTDPTQAQLEYVDQIVIGPKNTYDIKANTKEMLDYSNTGDFVVALALEGGMRLINVDVIRAELPKYKIGFYVNGIQYGEIQQVELGKAVDINNFNIEEIEAMNPGYRFVKWDKSVVNVTEDMSVNAVMTPKKYAVAFVDYENQKTELMELYYGESLPNPDVEPIEGKKFLGWEYAKDTYVKIDDDTEVDESQEKYYLLEDGKTYIAVKDYDKSKHTLKDETMYIKGTKTATVTGNMVVEANWETLKYTVKFADFDDSVVNEQKVAYGEAANPPEGIVKDEKVYTWSLDGEEWWNVTHDMVIYPHDNTVSTVSAPTINASTDEVGGTFYAELSTGEKNGQIFYTVNAQITQEEADKFAETVSTGDEMAIDTEQNGGTSLFGIKLFDDENSDESGSGEQNNGLKAYAEPIQITEGTVVYAFTVTKDGKASPISVFNYGYDTSVDEGIIENVYEIDPDCQQIIIPSITVNPGETIDVPVTLKNNPGISNLTLVFSYDSENLTLENAANGDVFSNSEYSADTREDGSCKFTWLSSRDNTKDGTLVTLTFKANANGGKYNIGMSIEESTNQNNEEEPFATKDGTVRNLGTDAHLGDVNGDGIIDFADAILLIRFDVGFSDLNEEQKKLADVNGDGEIDFADAVRILRFDAGFINSIK